MLLDLPPPAFDAAAAAHEAWRCGGALPIVARAESGFGETLWHYTDHFAIRYATEGENASPGQEYLDSLGSALEQAYRVFDGEHGLVVPPVVADTTDPAFGRTNVRIWNAPLGIRGQAGSYFGAETAAECHRGSGAVLWFDNKLEARDPVLKMVAAHELFHAFQFAVGGSRGGFTLESSARWSEILVHPDLFSSWNMYAHFNETNRYLLAGGNFHAGDRIQYGRAIWWYFLDEVLGYGATIDFWKRHCNTGDRSEDILRAILNEREHTLESASYLFAEWNVFTGVRDVGRSYERARELPLVWPQREHAKSEFGTYEIDDEKLAETLGVNYVALRGPATREDCEVTFAGDPLLDANRRVFVAATTSAGEHEIRDIALVNGRGETTLRDWARFEHVLLVVANGDLDEEQDERREYEYSWRETGDAVYDMNWLPSDLTRLRAAPNPFSLGTSIRFRAEGNAPVRADVYDVRGRLVARLADRAYPDGEHVVTWHGRTAAGERVAAGKYFLRVEQGAWKETRALVIAR